MTGRYKAYPEYKGSCVEWVESIPSSWCIKPLHILIDFKQGKAHEPFVDESGEYICVNSRFVSTGGASLKYVTKNLTPAKVNDVLMVMSDLPNGRALAKAFFVDTDEKYAVNQRVCALSAHSVVVPKFIYYQLDRSPYFLKFDDGLNQTHLTNDAFKKYPFLMPTIEEQQKIANFLDHETAKIETLITKQEKLIELLKEKRQAVISHAVTKGLNPDAPMIDSGVEWLGEVPEHWELPKLIQLTSRIGDGLHSTPRYADNTGYYFINGNNLKNGSIVISNTAKEVPEDEYKQHAVSLGGNSVFLSINGTIGSVALYNNEPIILGKSAAYINCETRLTPNFLMHFLQSSSALRYYELEATGTTISNLSLNSIRQMKVCLPAPKEQQNISEYCESQNKKYDALIGKAESLIKLIGERKTALISAAVTGKIDVRDWSQA